MEHDNTHPTPGDHGLLDQPRVQPNRHDRRAGHVQERRYPTVDEIRAFGVLARIRVKQIAHTRLVSAAVAEFQRRQRAGDAT